MPNAGLVGLIGLLIAALAGGWYWYRHDGLPRPDRELIYKRTPQADLRLQLFLPDGHAAGQARPAVAFFYGGGWVYGDIRQFYPQARALADDGLVAVCVEYRIRSRHDTDPATALADARSAIRYLRGHAGELGIDPQRIAAGGSSAGGHLAAASALIEAFDDPADDGAVSAEPDALILFNPMIDLRPGLPDHGLVADYWQAISPFHHIRPGMAPAVIFNGDVDPEVSVETIERFAEAIRAAGSRADLHIYPGQGHGFFNYGLSDNRYFELTLQATRVFLRQIGFLPAQ